MTRGTDINFRDYLQYDPDTGHLLWIVSRGGPNCKVGNEAGSIKKDGRYRSFVIGHKRYYTHRILWMLVNGPIPDGMCIDHIDGNGLNNRLDNLRLTTLSGNQRNRRVGKNTRFGIVGVSPWKDGYTVYCANKYVTWTKDFFEACCARKSAELRNGYYLNDFRTTI